MAGGSAAEAELVRAARGGDRGALEELIERHQDRVFGFGMKMCGDAEDAKEVLQETLLAMSRTVRDFRGDSSVSTWLYTIARSFCIKKRRRTKGAPVEHEVIDPVAEARLASAARGPEQAYLDRQLRAALAGALEELDPDSREVLVLRDIEGLTAPEVAAVTGASVDAVKSRLHRARVAVRARLAPVLGDEPAQPAGPACPDVLALYSKKLEDEVAPELCAEMEKHLEGCAHCRGLCDSLKHSLAVCRDVSTPRVPHHVAESLRAAVRAALASSR
jgi:RNA polymerase sigma-70 factor (ECF subfamily)